jgi:GTP-binding protein EngB required for normal cell division
MIQVRYLECNESNFKIFNGVQVITLTELTGTIIKEVERSCIKWVMDKKQPAKIYLQKGDKVPAGYNEAVEVVFKTKTGHKCKISFSFPQTKKYLEYKSQLENAGKNIRKVMTTMTPIQSGYNSVTYPNINFQEV